MNANGLWTVPRWGQLTPAPNAWRTRQAAFPTLPTAPMTASYRLSSWVSDTAFGDQLTPFSLIRLDLNLSN